MRGAIIFCAGFAGGVLFLALLMWQWGSLRPKPAAAAPPRPAVQASLPLPAPRAPNPLPDTRYTPASTAPLNPPPDQALQTASEGPPRLAIPVAGIEASQIADNFNDMRDGHAHAALDIMAPAGTPVLAADEGNIVKLFQSKPGGLTIYEFDDTQTYCYYYAHLESYAPGLRQGTLVRRGEILAYVGTTGDAPANAPHLHFAVYRLGPKKHWWEGTPIDPYPLLGASPSRER